MGERQLPPGDGRLVRRRERVPLLPFRTEREVRREHVGLGEIDPNAAIERRPAGPDAGGSRAAQKIDVVIISVDARLLFCPVADPQVEALVLSFGHPDTSPDARRLTLRTEDS